MRSSFGLIEAAIAPMNPSSSARVSSTATGEAGGSGQQFVDHRQRGGRPRQVVADAAVELLPLDAAGADVPHAGGAGGDGLFDTDSGGLGVAALFAEGDVGDDAGDFAIAVEEANLGAFEELSQDAAAEVGGQGAAVFHRAGDEAGVVHVGGEDPAGEFLLGVAGGEFDQQIAGPVAESFSRRRPLTKRSAYSTTRPSTNGGGGEGTDVGEEVGGGHKCRGDACVARPGIVGLTAASPVRCRGDACVAHTPAPPVRGRWMFPSAPRQATQDVAPTNRNARTGAAIGVSGDAGVAPTKSTGTQRPGDAGVAPTNHGHL